MNYVSIRKLQVPERQRKHFDEEAMAKLKEDIRVNGLMNPITVLQREKLQALIAGERRLKCISALHEEGRVIYCGNETIPKGKIPAVVFHNADEVRAFEMQLHENLLREKLTWQEEVTAIADLHKLRELQNPNQTFEATAKEISEKQGEGREVTSTDRTKVSHAVILDEFMDDKEVANATSEKEAFKILSRKLEAEFTSAATLMPRFESVHTLIHGDILEVWEDLPTNTYDCIITDPPYGIGAKNFKLESGLSHDYDESQAEALYQLLAAMASIVCKEEAHIYAFCDIDMFLKIRGFFIEEEWRVRRTPLVWNKMNRGNLPDANPYGYKRMSELVFHATRGGKLHTAIDSDILNFTPDGDLFHAAQKPVELYKKFMEMSTFHGDQVLDPFAGSGVIFAAATDLGRIATGVELDEKMVGLIETRREVRRTKEWKK